MKWLPWALIFFCMPAFAQKLTSIDFYQKGEVSFIEFHFDVSGVKATKHHVVADKQIILDFNDVQATERVLRAMDTSEFSGTVVFISPYKKPDNKKDIRVAIQLRDNARSLLESQGNKLVLNIENRFGVFDQLRVQKGKAEEQALARGENKGGSLNIPKSNMVEDILENLTMAGPKKYVGKKITLNVKDTPIVDILKTISDVSGFNIIIDKEVVNVPNLTLRLTNIPWDQALDTILSIANLVAKKNGNILMISTLEKATAEAQKAIQNQELQKKQEPLVTKVFPIKYAKLADMATITQDYITPGRGKVTTDERTNFLIVKDTVESIERIKKILETLDTQTPQVLIESKIVEVSENYAKNIGLGEGGVAFGYDPVGTIGSGRGTVGGPFAGNEDSALFRDGPGFSFNTAPSAAANLFGINIARLGRIFDLTASLQIMESENKAKIISSPRVITENKKTAEISSTNTSVFDVTVATESGFQTTPEEIPATLMLRVTPQVTNEGSIALEVDLTKEDFEATNPGERPPTSRRSLRTNVLVDNGATVVLGGVYRSTKNISHSGVPVLKDIPLIGWLFRTSYNPSEERDEMIIFLTPRIINQEEAGLTDLGQDDAT